jgi:RNA polymerase primary sigma factor
MLVNAAELEEVQDYLARLDGDPNVQETGVAHTDLLRFSQEIELSDDQLAQLVGLVEERGIDVHDVGETELEAARPTPQETLSAALARAKANVKPQTTDSLQLYLKEIGRVPLLTAKQEVELAQAYENGSERAKQQMIEANLRLVVTIAKH